MALDPNSATGQTQAIYNTLAAYFSDMTKYVSGTGGACPDFNTYIGASTDYSELHRLTSLSQAGSSNYPNGAAIETIHHITGILREFAIRTKSKSDYYSDSASDASSESNYYATLNTVYVSSVAGTPPPGGSL
jgi:hypothetical protein